MNLKRTLVKLGYSLNNFNVISKRELASVTHGQAIVDEFHMRIIGQNRLTYEQANENARILLIEENEVRVNDLEELILQ